MAMHPIKKGKTVYCKNRQELKEYLIFILGIYGQIPYTKKPEKNGALTIEFAEDREAMK